MDTVILIVMLVLSGCILSPPRALPPQQEPPALQQAMKQFKLGNKAMAIGQLRHLLKSPVCRCRSAFYLYSLDGFKNKYLRIMRSKECSKELIPELRLIDKLGGTKKTGRTAGGSCAARLKLREARIKKLKKDLAILKAENSRLKFELNKMEEIRRETEKLRLK